MSDLSFPITGAVEAARYFQVSVEVVQEALNQGVVTYQELYDHLQKKTQQMNERKSK